MNKFMYIVERAPLPNKPGNWSPMEASSTVTAAIKKQNKLKDEHPNETYRIMIAKGIALVHLVN